MRKNLNSKASSTCRAIESPFIELALNQSVCVLTHVKSLALSDECVRYARSVLAPSSLYTLVSVDETFMCTNSGDDEGMSDSEEGH
jgi:hypothetical protein